MPKQNQSKRHPVTRCTLSSPLSLQLPLVNVLVHLAPSWESARNDQPQGMTSLNTLKMLSGASLPLSVDLFWKCQQGGCCSCSLEVKAPQIRVSPCETMA